MSNLDIPETPLIEHVPPEKAQKLIEDGALVVDIRELKECDTKIAHAINIPMSEIKEKSLKLSDFSKSKLVLLQCQSSRRTKVFGELFQNFAGDVKLYALENGMNGWMAEGRPVVKTNPSTLSVGSQD